MSDLNLTIHSLALKYSRNISKASHYSSYEAQICSCNLIQRQPVGGKDRKCILMTLFFFCVFASLVCLLCFCCAKCELWCQVAVSLWLFESREHDINKNVNPLKVVNNNTERTDKNVRTEKSVFWCIAHTHTHILDNQSEIDFLYMRVSGMSDKCVFDVFVCNCRLWLICFKVNCQSIVILILTTVCHLNGIGAHLKYMHSKSGKFSQKILKLFRIITNFI